MRLPVVKILFGMFAFPAMYPGPFFRATSWQLLGLIGITLVWVSGVISPEDRVLYWSTLIANYGVFAWLAVRTHRLVLIGPDDPMLAHGADTFPLTFRYLSALTTGAAMKFLFILAVMLLVMLGSFFVAQPPVDVHAAPATPPEPDPDFQRMINYGAFLAQAPVIYLLARCGTLLPAIALGHEWSPRTAWRQTGGNGWRLVLVVFLIPWTLDAAIDSAYRGGGASAWLVGGIAIARAVFLALGVIALSLSYRELPPWPEPPPTAPPA